MVGYLDRWIPLSKGVCDAAVARFSEKIDYFTPWFYPGVGEMGTEVVQERYEVESVVKRGRTTRVTAGEVSVYELDGVSVNYGTRKKPRWVTFNGQMEFIGSPEGKAFSSQGPGCHL